MPQYSGVNMELSGFRLSQYLGFDFNSIGKIGNTLLGANESGIFKLYDGDDDAGEDIDSQIELPYTDMGTDSGKQVRRVYVGGEFYGDISVKAIADEKKYSSSPSSLTHEIGNQKGQSFDFPHTCRGRYISLAIENVDGADFSIDKISLALLQLTQKQNDKFIKEKGK